MSWTLREIMSFATAAARMSPDEVTPSRVSFLVNQAQRDVANRIQQVEFERIAVSSTSSGDDKVFLPTDCERVLNISFDTGGYNRVLPQTMIDQLDSKSQGTQAGLPQMWLSYATWVQFYPSPDSSYSLQMRYVARLSDMTNLEAVPSLDTRHHQAVVFKTVEQLGYLKGDVPFATTYRGLYESELRNQPSAMAQRQQSRAGLHARVQFRED